MINVKLTYDPYHMKTSLIINGIDVDESASYERIGQFAKQAIPLQSWMDAIGFQNWKGLLIEIIGNTNESNVAFEFFGREIDYLDFEASMRFQAQRSNNHMYDVDVSFDKHFIYDDKIVMERVKHAYELIQSEDFKRIIENKIYNIGENGPLWEAYHNLEKVYNDAMDSEFRIVFSGMYSSGKSTLINAILGKELLPMSDRTCTSKVFKIFHDSTASYAKMYCLDKQGQVVVPEAEYDAPQLAERFCTMFPHGENSDILPSVPETIETVVIKTNIASLYPSDANYSENNMKLVIMDTPGTSSGEGNMIEDGLSHFDITRGVIESEKKEIVILVTSAIEDKDDSIQDFLKIVDDAEEQGVYDQRFLFVINKADCCNFNDDESWKTKLGSIKKYYLGKKARKIQNPRFFPTSAIGALKVRTESTENDSAYGGVMERYYTFNRRQQAFLPAANREKYFFDEVCAASQSIKNCISKQICDLQMSDDNIYKVDKEIELHSGIVSLEMAIQDYIERYAFPLKIQSLLNTYEIIYKEVGQYVDIASRLIKEAEEDLKSKNDEKRSEETSKISEENKQKILKKVSNKIEKRKELLERICKDFTGSSYQKCSTITAQMSSEIDKAINLANAKSKYKSEIEKKREEIIAILEKADGECCDAIKQTFDEYGGKIQKIETEIKDFFDEIKGIVKIEGFSVEFTTAYHAINAKSFNDIKVSISKKDNWHYYHGFFTRFEWQRKLRGWLWGIDPEIKEYYLPEEFINNLDKLKALHRENIGDLRQKNKDNMERAVEILCGNMDSLKHGIENQLEQIQKIQKNIDGISKNIQEKETTKEQVEKDKSVIKKIQMSLNSVFDKEKEETV